MQRFIKLYFILCFYFLIPKINAQIKPIEITGKIGKYPIEITLTKFNKDSGTYYGKYNYAGKTSFLQLHGDLFEDCYVIDEYYKGKNTGTFYLTKQENSDSLKGWWKAENKEPLIALLKFKNTTTAQQLKPVTLLDKNKLVNDNIEGEYKTASYFISDLFFPNLERVYNGGSINFKKLGKDSLKFSVEMICGPTYHMAYADGIAIKKGKEYVYKADIIGDGKDFCEIKFTFKNKTVYAIANSSMACGFGARAYLDNELVKVSNTFKFSEK